MKDHDHTLEKFLIGVILVIVVLWWRSEDRHVKRIEDLKAENEILQSTITELKEENEYLYEVIEEMEDGK